MIPGIVSVAGKAGSPPSEIPGGSWSLPAGVPDPIVWFSPDFVTVDSAPEVTVIENRGSGGSTYDATPNATNKLKITNTASWNSKDVFDTTAHTSGGYALANPIEDVRTVVTLTTYDGGASTFGSFDGLVSGAPNGVEYEITGSRGSASLFNQGIETMYKDGIALATVTTAILPMVKSGLAANEIVVGRDIGMLWRDNFSATRYWEGLTGDIIIWDEELTPTQIEDVHNNMVAYYTA